MNPHERPSLVVSSGVHVQVVVAVCDHRTGTLMPRIRSIKPDFFKSRSVKKLTDREKLVWIGLWPYADDYGRLLDEPAMIAGELWAVGLNEKRMNDTLQGLHRAGRITRYQVNGEGFIQVTGWEHQKISHPTDSNIPPIPVESHSGTAPEPFVLEGIGEERKGEEGTRGSAPHPLPPDYALTQPMRDWAATNAPAALLDREFMKFRDYWLVGNGAGKKHKSWDQTLRTWLLRAQGDAEQRGWKPNTDTWAGIPRVGDA